MLSLRRDDSRRPRTEQYKVVKARPFRESSREKYASRLSLGTFRAGHLFFAFSSSPLTTTSSSHLYSSKEDGSSPYRTLRLHYPLSDRHLVSRSCFPRSHSQSPQSLLEGRCRSTRLWNSRNALPTLPHVLGIRTSTQKHDWTDYR